MRRRCESGFSLVEVILALGLLAAVLISIAGLFVLGARQVHSGRTSSEALSVASAILEEMEAWGFRQTYERFDLDGSADVHVVDTRDPGYAARWQVELERMLHDAHATIEIRSLAGVVGSPPPLAETRAIRVVVTVHWGEGLRQRQMQLATVRM